MIVSTTFSTLDKKLFKRLKARELIKANLGKINQVLTLAINVDSAFNEEIIPYTCQKIP